MPIYEYQCDGCGEVFEVLQRHSDPPPPEHEACGSKDLHKVMSATSFVLKGEGWYITDYARKDKKGGSDKGGEAAKESSKSTDTSSASPSSASSGSDSGKSATASAAGDSKKSVKKGA